MKSLALIVREALQTLKLKNKNPFKQDLRLGGGMDRDGGQSRSRGSDGDASYSGSGSGFSRQGQKGWSRSAKQFDLPQDSNPLDKSVFDNLGETEEIWKDPPVGQRVPELGFGGRGGPGIKTLYLGPRKK